MHHKSTLLDYARFADRAKLKKILWVFLSRFAGVSNSLTLPWSNTIILQNKTHKNFIEEQHREKMSQIDSIEKKSDSNCKSYIVIQFQLPYLPQ